ncbi:MAG: 3-hydroxybutyryl-CoA dehydrogenase [Bacteroidetes bacterium 43-16]|nr:MAG: 3-hydroxybutyryl-CoA dehydrogenase [Bacteroidetes bacterium 43-16]
MSIKNVTVAGSGVLGAQIALQSAYHGFNVTVYDISDDILTRAKATFERIAEAYRSDLRASQASIDAAFARLSYSADLATAVQDADLLIEAIPENPAIKTEFYQKLAAVAPEKTIFATNTSTLLPSMFAAATGRPEKFLALHFANEIWKHNTAEIMGHAETDKAVFDTIVAFAKDIGMIALPLHKEQPAYILNSLLVPLLSAASALWANGVADPETIDKTWMAATGAPTGPFGMLDVVGLTTAYNINKMAAEAHPDPLKLKIVELLKGMIDEGKSGVASGKGFYTYPDPAYKAPDFLK